VEEAVVTWLKSRRALLVLDNCEHLVPVCAELISGILRACPQVWIIATSRQLLSVDGETVWRVPPLEVISSRQVRGPEDLVRAPATQLFLERAVATDSRFQVTRDAAAIAEICTRLDGLPLAIELAAARVRTLGIRQILERLDKAVELLVGGDRTAAPRLQTLRAALDWSCSLLSAPELGLFRGLAVFAAGWSLEAAETICANGQMGRDKVLESLTYLVEASLVEVLTDGEARARYRLLEPIRQYADGHLHDDERLELRLQHQRWYAELVHEAAAARATSAESAWMSRLEMEHDNLRRALEFACASSTEAEGGCRMAAELWWFWQVKGHWLEGMRWLDRLMESSMPRLAAGSQAALLYAAGML
jgi:predicted ATPase